MPPIISRPDNCCLEHHKPWVYGSVFRYEGQVSVFRLNGGPGLPDLFPGVTDGREVPDPHEYGLTGVLPGIIGTFQAGEALKIITGIGEPLSGKLLQYNMLNNTLETFTF
jgi:adenylyltransferase/sulfurtransferase